MKNINTGKRAAVIAAVAMALMLIMPISVFAEPSADGAQNEYVFDVSGSLAADQQTILNTRCGWLKECHNRHRKQLIVRSCGPGADSRQPRSRSQRRKRSSFRYRYSNARKHVQSLRNCRRSV